MKLHTVDNSYVRELEQEWKKTLPVATFSYLIETFPEAKRLIKQNLRNKIAQCDADLRRAWQIEQELENIIYLKSPKDDEWFWRAVGMALFVNPLREGREETIKRCNFQLQSLTKKPTLDINRAKEYPIDSLITFRQGKARCLWHEEKTPSMHYYKKSNRIKCFGCNKSADVIDVYMQLYNVSFNEAVKKLS